MPKVKDLKIARQSNSSTYYATWEYDSGSSSSGGAGGSGNVKTGEFVSIKPGATYYNGVAIPDWVMAEKWQVVQVIGDRAVLGKNPSGVYNIMSPINVTYLTGSDPASAAEAGSEPVADDTLDHYTVEWFYQTGDWYYDTKDGVWFSGGSSDVAATLKNATYSAPSNAIQLKVTVTPVAKTHKVNDKDVAYWTGTAVSETYSIEYDPPETPSTPTVTIEQYKLTTSLENISDYRTDQIQFAIYKDDAEDWYKSEIVAVRNRRASYSCGIEAGGEYRAQCRAATVIGNATTFSAWSDFSSAVSTIPSAPDRIMACVATSETSVRLAWSTVLNADTYEIQYATKREYLESSDQTSNVTGIESPYYEKTGLESGQEYFFRVRAVNAQGNSSWTLPASIIIGKKPAAPTTWSSTTTAITGEPLTLYWVHNSEDGSSQTFAELELYVDGVKESHTIKNTDVEEEKDKTSSYAVNTSLYREGTTIQWRVRTAGVTKTYGDWSIQRTIDIYAPATLTLKMTNSAGSSIDTLRSFPFYVSALAGPNTQAPIGYHLTIAANDSYKTVDQVGNLKMVSKGQAVYSQYFDITSSLLVELSAGNIDLENNIRYTVACVVSMDSGLTAEATVQFTVSWQDIVYEPGAEIGIDKTAYSAYIRPYCDGDVLLSVYRKEFDGRFTELATGIDPSANTYITDPHPALDYARYRIVATTKSTGAVSYYDPPGYPVGGNAVLIQWDEKWTSFSTTDNPDPMERQPWNGSMLQLPYNIDVSDSSSHDVTLAKYIGRSHPVSYYGTQVGSTATWNVEIEKADKETLYALRRLSMWMGDVYVREPSGSGYWANISVSFNQQHLALTIPVTLEITRVEGGI